MKPFQVVISVIGIIVLVACLSVMGRIFENVGADEIVIIQDPIDGDLHVFTDPGLKYQNFGKSTHYKKRFQYWFSEKGDQGEDINQSIKIRFNDGGHAFISGSVSCENPIAPEPMTQLHVKYGSQSAIEQELIRTVYEKSVYMTGPLMSSKESYAEKRTELINYIEDQASNGVYATKSIETRGVDPMTGAEKTITVVDIVQDANAPNGIERQEESALNTFGIRTYNISINSIVYDSTVENQIAAQQKAIMEVQTAIATAKKAEQNAITVAKEGEATAVAAKWEQEKLNAGEIAAAEKNLKIAELDRQKAEQYKQEQILRGQGEAEYKRLVIQADGALAQKLATYEAVMGRFAAEFSKQKWVPEVVMGSGSGSQNSATNLIDLLTAKTLKDLGLDMSVRK
jgi:hypothetical protein